MILRLASNRKKGLPIESVRICPIILKIKGRLPATNLFYKNVPLLSLNYH